MDNELIIKRPWWRKKRIWLLGLPVVALLCYSLALFGSGSHFMDSAEAYSDPALFQGAIEIANKDKRIIGALGTLEAVDKMAILEGNVQYSATRDSVGMTIRVAGNKGKAKMDITAIRRAGIWEYQFIKVRIKKSGETILVPVHPSGWHHG